jgi:hypothetical protein
MTDTLLPDTDPTDEQIKKKKLDRAATAAHSEILFVVLPFIVIAITLGHRGELNTIFFLPEWSIVSAVIVGQTIVKLASCVIGKSVPRERVVFVLSGLLVCLLVPILVILAIVLTANKVSVTLAVTQAVLFVISVVFFRNASITETMIGD